MQPLGPRDRKGELVALILFEAGGRLEEPDISTIEQQVIADPPELRLRLALRVPSTPTTRRVRRRSSRYAHAILPIVRTPSAASARSATASISRSSPKIGDRRLALFALERGMPMARCLRAFQNQGNVGMPAILAERHFRSVPSHARAVTLVAGYSRTSTGAFCEDACDVMQ